MRVHVMDLQPGDKLTKDIHNSYGLHVLSAESILDAESITKLLYHNIDYVEVQRGSDAPNVSGSSRVRASYHASVGGIGTVFEQALEEGKIDPSLVDTSFEPLADSFRSENDLVSLMLCLENNDDYTFHHSVQVGMLAYYIAKWLGQPEPFALITGKAGFLHDVGKSRIAPEILQKPAKLTDDEFESIKLHAVYGKEILELSYEPDSPIVLGAYEHHERLNGHGYPRGLKGDEIHYVSRILSVADIYSAMISSRVYQKERDMLYVLRELHRISFGEIDPLITQVFIRNMIPHFEGKNVLLNTGEQGMIVLTNPSDFFNPMIQVDHHFIDLSKRPDLHIMKILNP